MHSKFKKACVTGGAGFIGTHLVRALLERGISVNVLDNLSVGRSEIVPAQASLIRGDVLDANAVKHALEDCDVVFHLAARVAIRSSFDFVFQDAQTNFLGTASLMEGVAKTESVKKVLFTSSMAVYADADSARPINEEYPRNPISTYGISKLGAEQLVHTMSRALGIQSNVLRLFNTYGAGQALSPYVGVVTIFVDKLASGENPTIFSDGEQSRDFVHVADIVQALLGAMDHGPAGETFNVGSGIPRSVNSILALLNKHMGTNQPGIHVAAATGELRYSTADISKAATMLNYCPRFTLESSISEVISEILSRPAARSASIAR
jgi:UDP-glucose 4-epimerase